MTEKEKELNELKNTYIPKITDIVNLMKDPEHIKAVYCYAKYVYVNKE